MNIILIIILTSLFLVTFKMFVAFFMDTVKAYKAKNWPYTEGVITKNMYVSQTFEGYDFEIEFQYEVNQKPYKTNTPYFGPTNKVGDSQKNLILDVFKKDSIVKVFYNPKSPNEATLITGFNKLQIEAIGMLLIIGSISSFFGVLALVRLSVEF